VTHEVLDLHTCQFAYNLFKKLQSLILPLLTFPANPHNHATSVRVTPAYKNAKRSENRPLIYLQLLKEEEVEAQYVAQFASHTLQMNIFVSRDLECNANELNV